MLRGKADAVMSSSGVHEGEGLLRVDMGDVEMGEKDTKVADIAVRRARGGGGEDAA